MKNKMNIVINVFIILIVTLTIAGYFKIQNDFLNKVKQDEQKKMAINKIYFYLNQEYKKNNYYPEFIDYNLLKKELPLKDTNSKPINSPDSDYKYETYNCKNNLCKNFILSSELELEAKYIKQN